MDEIDRDRVALAKTDDFVQIDMEQTPKKRK
jgi:hypothetical protein